MAAPFKPTPFLAAALLVLAGGLACRKPAPAPAPTPKVEAPAPKPAAETQSKVDDGAKAAADAAEAARKAAAAAEQAYRDAAQAALKDVHFGYDKSDIQEADKPVLQGIADFMKRYSKANLLVDGNCDERGTVEYNLGLGERRAHAASAYLTGLGVAAERMTILSYGKEKPVCTESVESCWSRNRRAHFSLK
jgi:peptidoglycan-associated lipoprotein